eukprot:6685632-Prymnesium_polylepis.1
MESSLKKSGEDHFFSRGTGGARAASPSLSADVLPPAATTSASGSAGVVASPAASALDSRAPNNDTIELRIESTQLACCGGAAGGGSLAPASACAASPSSADSWLKK